MLGQEKIMAAANMDTEMVFPNRLISTHLAYSETHVSVRVVRDSKHKMNG